MVVIVVNFVHLKSHLLDSLQQEVCIVLDPKVRAVTLFYFAFYIKILSHFEVLSLSNTTKLLLA